MAWHSSRGNGNGAVNILIHGFPLSSTQEWLCHQEHLLVKVSVPAAVQTVAVYPTIHEPLIPHFHTYLSNILDY